MVGVTGSIPVAPTRNVIALARPQPCDTEFGGQICASDLPAACSTGTFQTGPTKQLTTAAQAALVCAGHQNQHL